MLGLAIFGIAVFVVFIVSTFGWRTFRHCGELSPEGRTLIERLNGHVKKLSSDIGDRSIFRYEKLKEARDYIVNEFKSYGYEVELHGYTLYDKSSTCAQVLGKYSENIIVNKKGTSDEIIIVSAHYDTCFNPGADDNASSVAGLLELARMLAGSETGYTIRFIAFVNEEPPFFKTENMGSFQYLQGFKEKIKGAMILEMIGYYSDKLFSQRYPPFFGLSYPNRANFIAIVSNFESRRFAKEIKVNFKKHSRFPIESVATFSFVPGVDFSDNWSFWKAGLPAVMITDTAFYRYPYYHLNQDTYEKLNYEGMSEVVYGLYKAIASMEG